MLKLIYRNSAYEINNIKINTHENLLIDIKTAPNMEFKENLNDYTENEFIGFLKEFFENPKNLKGKELKNHIEKLVSHFDKIIDHPEGNGLIFNPPDDRDDSPEAVINEIKRWRKSQGLPLFEDSK